jgi:ferredoxin
MTKHGAERNPEPVKVSTAVQEIWPDVSGNSVNGLGETGRRAPHPVFWRTDGSTAHEPVQFYFYDFDKGNQRIIESRNYMAENKAMPIHDVAPEWAEKSADEWSSLVKQAALDCGADEVGICAYRPEWTFDDRPQPKGHWAIVMGFAHDYDNMKTAPDDNSYVEVMAQYDRGGKAAINLSNWVRDQGFIAQSKTGPATEDVLMIPAAIEAGLGELGKHGSLINRKYGSSFRLSMVTTDMPLLADQPDIFGADQFCESCQLCTTACPPDAISDKKQQVRGDTKWYVNFDKCLPYFVENLSCGLCLVVCPWSRPGLAENLVQKMARRAEIKK